MITQDDIDAFKDDSTCYDNYNDFKEQKRAEALSPLQMVREFATTMDQPLDLKPGEDGFESSEELGFNLVEEEFSEFFDAVYEEFDEITNGTSEHTFKECLDLIFVLYGYCARRGWDADKGMVALFRNNMGRCIQPDGSIKRNEQGKILKNPDYPKVDLKGFL